MRKVIGVLLIMAGIAGVLFALNPGNLFPRDLLSFGTKEISKEKTVDAGDFRNVFIESGSPDVQILRGNSDQIKVRLKGQVSPKYADRIDIKVAPQGDTLELGVEVPNDISLGINILNVDFIVELPEKQWDGVDVNVGSGNVDVSQLYGNKVLVKTGSGDILATVIEADTIALQASSGNVKAQHFKADALTFDTGSGNTDAAQITGKTVNVKSSSGNIQVQAVEADAITLQANSGNVTADEFKAETLTFNTDSGTVDLANGEAALQGVTSSGNIEVKFDDLLHDADLKANSGSVTVDLANEPKSLAVDFRGGSGNGRIEWNGMTYEENSENGSSLKGAFGSGEAKLKVRTSSGDFTLGSN
ncbi:DUF4097 domain-containing protein [Paenibacillus sp. MER TA 81-3]|uniref:DUF4097 family beta strand repeat-containing protein n=1 Tax=Paenibacillus sp. MER TA 81-3 TaxID=2939573 RepID=UPI002041CB42|nr:DUF4097 family beta strand repeat-containing protein [Paenibacillus sp. MER TA 81-3]MCM3342220.1 DUF4097 domain-containing protein [Paenibacillus sp. MER TA 81-3]